MKKVLFDAGVGNTDRAQRWDFVLHLWERLASTFEVLGVRTLVVHHPILTAVTPAGLKVDLDDLQKVMEDYEPDFVFVWNGNSDGDRKVIEQARAAQAKMVYGELGWFPQKGHLHFDLNGVNADSSFSVPNFPKLLPLEQKELDDFREGFRKGKPPLKEPGDYHLITLQDETDSNILNSTFDCMTDFVCDVMREHKEDGLPFRVRKHPHHPHVDLSDVDGEYTLDEGDLYESIAGAHTVHAINSTVLLEAAMLGKRISPWGKGVIHPGLPPRCVDSLLYTLISRQLRWGDLLNVKKMRFYPVFNEAGIFDGLPS